MNKQVSGHIQFVVITPKGFWLCFHQKHSKTVISNTSTKFLKKNIFGHM